MANVWIERRRTSSGRIRYRIRYTLGGRGARKRYAGSFPTMREAEQRKQYVAGELASRRVPVLHFPDAEQSDSQRLGRAAERWLATRIDIAESTRTRHGVELKRIKGALGSRHADTLTAADVAEFVAALAVQGLARGTIRKTLQTLAMVLDHAGVDPNPARDRSVKLPRADEEEKNWPTAEHVGGLPALAL